MKRFILVTVFSTLAVGVALAGPVAINLATAGNNGGTDLNKNLATGYIPCTVGTAGGGLTCTTSNSVLNPYPSGIPTSFANVLFNGTQVPFDIASGGADSGSGVGNTPNIWAPGNSAGDQSKLIDVGTYTTNASGQQTSSNTSGLFGVDEIWTMLNDVYASVGTQGITLTLNGYDATGTTAITETINLLAGADYRSIGNSNTPQDITVCDVANIGIATLGSSCNGHSSSTAQTSGTDTTKVTSNYSGVAVTVYNNLYTTGDTLTQNNPTTAQDIYWLDAQAITLGNAFTNGWLNSITITSHDGSTGMAEKSILSALTVDQITPTPEPTTVGLMLFGLGGFGFSYWKRSKKA